MNIRIFPPDDILQTTVELPLSKSISARALIINALTPGAAPLPVSQLADCDDTRALSEALASDNSSIDIGAAGTAMRFLTAYYAVTEGCDVLLDGNERMRRRPIAPLVDALRTLGADISYAGDEGFAPLRIRGRKLKGGELHIDATVSSQFVSAILMVAPAMEKPLHMVFDSEIISRPYIAMTVDMMRHSGISAELTRDYVDVPSGTYMPTTMMQVERDWSAASYWYEIAAVTAGWVTLPGLSLQSLQGDAELAAVFPRLGVLTDTADDGDGLELSATPDLYSRLELDAADTPDIVPALAVTAVMVGIPFRLTGVANLRHKECDRLEALRAELLKLGAVIEIEPDALVWEGQRVPVREIPAIDTHDDHRIAMAFAPVAAYVPGIVINNAEVVHKSYPDFWKHLTDAGFILTDADIPLTPDTADDPQ